MKYTSSLEEITVNMLKGGFFVNWPNPPSPETHLKLLEGSHRVILAVDEESKQVVGFINAISDGVFCLHSASGSVACLPRQGDWKRTRS